jgi:hypothetical protein
MTLKVRFKKAPIFLEIKHTHILCYSCLKKQNSDKMSRANVFNTTNIVHMPYKDYQVEDVEGL